jgi:anti-sigma factor RsiW
MNGDECLNLDAFLLGDLAQAEASRFTGHLAHCDTCRDAVDKQRWIDELLMSPIRVELESPPDTLIESCRTAPLVRRQQTRVIAGVFAAAAALAIAAGWTVLNRQAGDIAAPGGKMTRSEAIASVPDTFQTEIQAPEPPRATFVGGPDVLVVPVASRHPNVTVVRVYPTYQPSYDTQASIEPFELDDLNGG